MTGELRTHDGDGGFYPCALCGNDAAGPCAKCKRPTCGDCCVLVGGTAGRWAICTRCERRHGASARRAWVSLGFWLLLPLAFLTALLSLLHWLFG
jgi:hypothetical protein